MKKIILLITLALTLSAEVKVGDTVSNFKLPYLYDTSKEITLQKNIAKVTLINLWASWCTGCKEEMPLFVQFQKKYDPKDFKIILSSIDKKRQNSIDFLNEVDKNKVLLAVYDKEKVLPKEYRAIGMPSSYLIDENLKIIKIFVGSLSMEDIKELENQIDSLLEK